MKRLDLGAAINGALFMCLALWFLAHEGKGSAADLGVLVPLLFVVLGLGSLLGAGRRDRDRDRD